MTVEALQIRPARTDECDAITLLGIRSKSIWDYPDSMMDTFREELTILPKHFAECEVFVALLSKSIVGYYSLREIGPDENGDRAIELEHLFVDPKHLHKGIGTKLFKHAKAHAASNGYRNLVIQCDPNAAGFYSKLGVPLLKEIPSSVPGRMIPWFQLTLSINES